MPPGQGKRDLHLSIDAEAKAYLEKEASYRRIPVSALLLDAVDLILNPERNERAALADELHEVSQALAALRPALQACEQTAGKSAALSHELEQFQAEMRQALAGIEAQVAALTQSHQQARRDRFLVGGFGAVSLLCLLYVVARQGFF